MRRVECPYFGQTFGANLTCLPDGETFGENEMQMAFPSKRARTRYWKEFCCGNWGGCPLTKILEEEFEGMRK